MYQSAVGGQERKEDGGAALLKAQRIARLIEPDLQVVEVATTAAGIHSKARGASGEVAAGIWQGVIHRQVLEVDDGKRAGYGARGVIIHAHRQ